MKLTDDAVRVPGGDMSALAVVNAERIKLSTIRSPLWSAVAVAVLSLGLAAIQASTAYGPGGLRREKAAIGVAVFGVPGADDPFGDDRHGGVPQRHDPHDVRGQSRIGTLVLVAKAVVAAVFSGVYTAVMVMASVVVARLRDPGDAWRPGRRAIALYATLRRARRRGRCAAARTRRARSRCCCCGRWWPSRCWATCPTSVPEIGPYLPFANAFRFVDVQWLYPYYAMPWGPVGSIVYFAVVVAAVVFVAALVTGQPARRVTNVGAMGRTSRGVLAALAAVGVVAALGGCGGKPAKEAANRRPRPRPSGAAAEFASTLRDKVKADAMMAHLQKLQEIADANDGNRALGTAGLRRQRRLRGQDAARQGFRRQDRTSSRCDCRSPRSRR